MKKSINTKVFHPIHGVGVINTQIYESKLGSDSITVLFKEGSTSVPKAELRIQLLS